MRVSTLFRFSTFVPATAVIIFAGQMTFAQTQSPAQSSFVPSIPAEFSGSNSGARPADNRSEPAQLSILIPESPTESSFTQTQSDGGVGSESIRMSGDGGQAIGTFATENRFVRQAGEDEASRSPQPASSPSPAMPSISQNGLRGNAQSVFGANSPVRINGFDNQSPPAAPTRRAVQVTGGGSAPLQIAPNQQTRSLNPAQGSYQSAPQNNQSNQRFGHQTTGNMLQPASGFSAQSVDRSNRENQVRPTSFNQSTDSNKQGRILANQLLDRYDVHSAPSPLPGQPTKMVEMLKQPLSTEQRREMVSQYWVTYYDWSTFLSRAEYLSWLTTVTASSSPSDLALLNAAKSAAANRVLAAEIQLGKSQSRLMDYLPQGQSELLPLPCDKPLVQKYRTNYEVYRNQGLITKRLRGIDEMLPKMLNLIAKRAETVQVARNAADNAKSSLATRQTNVASVLEAGRIWRDAEQDLIASVTSYNEAIGDYALTISRGAYSPEQIAGMLIAKPKSNSSRINSISQGQQTTNQQSAQQFGQPNRQAVNSQFNPRQNSQSNLMGSQSANNVPSLNGASSSGFNAKSQFGNRPAATPDSIANQRSNGADGTSNGFGSNQSGPQSFNGSGQSFENSQPPVRQGQRNQGSGQSRPPVRSANSQFNFGG